MTETLEWQDFCAHHPFCNHSDPPPPPLTAHLPTGSNNTPHSRAHSRARPLRPRLLQTYPVCCQVRTWQHTQLAATPRETRSPPASPSSFLLPSSSSNPPSLLVHLLHLPSSSSSSHHPSLLVILPLHFPRPRPPPLLLLSSSPLIPRHRPPVRLLHRLESPGDLGQALSKVPKQSNPLDREAVCPSSEVVLEKLVREQLHERAHLWAGRGRGRLSIRGD